MSHSVQLTSEHTIHKYRLTVSLLSFRDTQEQLRKIRQPKIPSLQNYKSIQLRIAGQIIRFQKLRFFDDPNQVIGQIVKDKSVDIAFSTQLNKYYPIKSLIKIYEIPHILTKQQHLNETNKFQTVLGVSGLSTESLIESISPKNQQVLGTFQGITNSSKAQFCISQPEKAQLIIKKVVSDIQIAMKLQIYRQKGKQSHQIINQQPKYQTRKSKSVRKISRDDSQASFYTQRVACNQGLQQTSSKQALQQKLDKTEFKDCIRSLSKCVISSNVIQQNISPREYKNEGITKIVKEISDDSDIMESGFQLTFKSRNLNGEEQKISSDFTFRNNFKIDTVIQMAQSQSCNQPKYNQQEALDGSIFQDQTRFYQSLRLPTTPSSVFVQKNKLSDQDMYGFPLLRSSQMSQNDRSHNHQQLQQEITYYQEQLDTVGSQLIGERREIAKLQQKLIHFSKKNNSLKLQNFLLSNQIYEYVEYFKILSDNISNFQSLGKNFQIDQLKKSLTILYKNQSFVGKFKNFIEFIQQKLATASKRQIKKQIPKNSIKRLSQDFFNSSQRKHQNSELENEQSEQMTKSELLSPTLPTENFDQSMYRIKKNSIPFISNNRKIQIQKQMITLKQQCYKLQQIIRGLKQQLQIKDAQIQEAYLLLDQKNTIIGQKQQQKAQLNEQMFFVGQRIKDLQNQVKELSIKIQNKQQLINAKDQTIEHFDRLITKQRQTIELLSIQKEQQEKKLENFKNLIDEKNEQIEDLNQKLQKYVEQYGQPKGKKNKILQKQIKDCIRWLDSKNKDQMDFSNICQSEVIFKQKIMISPIKNEGGQSETVIGNISSVIKSMQINGVSTIQIINIRDQLLKVLERVNGLLNQSKRQEQIGMSDYLKQIKCQTSFIHQ